MDHLNLFNAYKNKSSYHEDELTRSFLILLKNIPIVQMLFFELVRKEMKKVQLESITTEEFAVEEVYTQISNKHDLFKTDKLDGRTLISIIISDDKYETGEKVSNVNRNAVYDGVVKCYPSWVFIIENKPFKENIWVKQLSPNILEERDINIIEQPCCLSWREIITILNSHVEKGMLSGFELSAVIDFIEYVDNEFSWINPYTSFGVCKENIYLLNKRCYSIMGNCLINGEKREVKHHKGWKDYIDSGVNTIKQIALYAENQNNGITIKLDLVAGDSMSAAKETYDKLNIEKFLELKKYGFELKSNFHISYRSSNLLWFSGELSIDDYITFWKSEYKNLKQIKREQFSDYFRYLEDKKMIQKEDRSKIQEKIINKRYDKLNICPGIVILYRWDLQTAVSLDKSNEFEEDYYNKLMMVFDTIGGI